jgi:hypothetical protein
MLIPFILAGLCIIHPSNLLSAVNWDDKTLQDSFKELSLQQGAVSFQPPEGWRLADPKSLPSHVKMMVVGKGSSNYPPSINLAYDTFNGTLKEYLKLVEAINKRLGSEWIDIGLIQTLSGEARLLQLDSKNAWGQERQMQVILVKDGIAYILTASALREEFSQFYPQFFKSLKSLKIN